MNIDFGGMNDTSFFVIVLLIALGSLVATRKLLKISFPYFFMGVLGLILGLLIGNMVGKSLEALPGLYGRWLPIIVEVFVAVAVLDLFMAQAKPAARFFNSIFNGDSPRDVGDDIIVDTSALIDGRIEEIVQTGFLMGNLVVPRFILNELQNIADSGDLMKKARGRRGLEVLGNLQKNRDVTIEISEEKTREKEKVDARLTKIAKEKGARLLTLDYNLSQVAQIQGVRVLNINTLAVAVKQQLVPGENLDVRVLQKGKEKKQGVGYLDDGTMVVVEGGDKFVGEDLSCEVVRIYQTTAGKMIFVQPKNSK